MYFYLFVVDGKWGEYGAYGECSKPCGGGAKERFRKCNNPAPAHGGKKCAGFAKFVMICNMHRCPGVYIHFVRNC